MKTVLYLDELLLMNFVIGAALLLCAGLLCARQCSGVRLCAGGVLAAASALILLAPELPFVPALVYKALTCAGAVAAAYGLPGVRCFAHLCAWYTLLNLLLCGAVVLPGVHSNNFSVYLPVSPGRLLACTAAVYAVLQGVLFCFGRAEGRASPAVLMLGGVRIPVQAFYDTGFSLQEPLSGRTVVLVHYPAVRGTLAAPLQSFLDAYFAGNASPPPPGLGVRLVPCATVSGQSLLPAVPAQALELHGRRADSLLAAFCSPASPPESWTLLYGADTAAALHHTRPALFSTQKEECL